MSGWQPISTAPRDGTNVLLWADGEYFLVGHWSGQNEFWVCPGAVSCVWNDGQHGPTHWLPIPPPPTEREE